MHKMRNPKHSYKTSLDYSIYLSTPTVFDLCLDWFLDFESRSENKIWREKMEIAKDYANKCVDRVRLPQDCH